MHRLLIVPLVGLLAFIAMSYFPHPLPASSFLPSAHRSQIASAPPSDASPVVNTSPAVETAPETSSAKEEEEIPKEGALAVAQECDRLGADPDDRERKDAGVADDQIIAAVTIEACALAAEVFDEPRFVHQYARAQLAGDNKQEALQAFEASGYCPSSYYLGRAAEEGWTGTPDAASAERHYATSAACGHAKAQLAVNRTRFDPKTFLRPDVMKALEAGDIQSLNKLRPVHAAYFRGFFEQLGNQWLAPEAQSGGCATTLFQPGAISYALDSAQDGDPDNALERIGFQAILRILIWFEPTYGQQGLDRFRQILHQAGQTDALRMIKRHGCDSAVAKRLVQNLEQFSKARKSALVLARELYRDPHTNQQFRKVLSQAGLPAAVQQAIFQ